MCFALGVRLEERLHGTLASTIKLLLDGRHVFVRFLKIIRGGCLMDEMVSRHVTNFIHEIFATSAAARVNLKHFEVELLSNSIHRSGLSTSMRATNHDGIRGSSDLAVR